MYVDTQVFEESPYGYGGPCLTTPAQRVCWLVCIFFGQCPVRAALGERYHLGLPRNLFLEIHGLLPLCIVFPRNFSPRLRLGAVNAAAMRRERWARARPPARACVSD